MADAHKKIVEHHYGIGGHSCRCCGPKDKKEKRIANKKARQKLKKDLTKTDE